MNIQLYLLDRAEKEAKKKAKEVKRLKAQNEADRKFFNNGREYDALVKEWHTKWPMPKEEKVRICNRLAEIEEQQAEYLERRK